jgi:DNA (cytosine-5)-methyltransferase 1
VSKLRVLDLFSGIGGFSLGLERTGGFETVAFCEIEPFPRKVLAKHWPGVKCYEDVTKLTGDILRRDGISVDVITGGFPCQDISCAGKQAGIGEGTRSGLWSEIVRLIGELSPRYVIVENVAALLSGPGEQRGGWFGSILGDLAECGYDAEWENIPAAAVGAPHRRERVWIVAYPNKKIAARLPSRTQAKHTVAKCRGQILANAGGIGQPRQGGAKGCQHTAKEDYRKINRTFHDGGWAAEPSVGRMAYGVPNGMDRLSACGNAVVPKIPELIGRAIMQAEAAL